jgi:organic radical activating enzyme
MKIKPETSAQGILKHNKAFCAAPFIHTHNWPDGRVYPCCMGEYKLPVGQLEPGDSFEKVWNGEGYRQLRKDVLAGKMTKTCHRCYQQEKHNNKSLRTELTSRYWEDTVEQVNATDEEGNAPLKMVYWDYRFNNLCNFSCRTCGPDLSSSWYEDYHHLYNLKEGEGRIPNKFQLFDKHKGTINHELIESQLENVKEVYFAGGEPTIMPEHSQILLQLIEAGRTDVTLRYSTNLSVTEFKGVNFLELWPKFKEVLLFVSLDEIEERAEYWRNGTNWKRLFANMLKIKEMASAYPNVKVGYSPTVSIFNVYRIYEMLKFLEDNVALYDENEYGHWPNTPIALNTLIEPTRYNIRNAPRFIKELAYKSLDKCLELKLMTGNDNLVNQINSIKSWLDDKPDLINFKTIEQVYEDFALNMARLDKIRNQSLKDVAPELYEFYRLYGYDKEYEHKYTPITRKSK